MSFVTAAVIVGGSTLAAGGLSYMGAQSAADATREGAGIAADAAMRGSALQMEMFRQAQRTLQPFANLGLGAGSTFAAQSVSPQEKKRQLDLQRSDLEAEVARLSVPIPDSAVAPPGGKNSSERWAAMLGQMRGDQAQQRAEAQSKLDAFNKRTEIELGQLDARQAEGIQASPLYEFQRDLGERNIKRQLSATGRLDTGFGMETLSNFYRALGAEETERQTGRLQFLTTVGANAAAGQATNAMNTGTTQAGLLTQYGQSLGMGTAQAGQIQGAGIQGVGRTLQQTGLLGGLALGYMGNQSGATIGSFQDQAYLQGLQKAQATGVPQTYFSTPGY